MNNLITSFFVAQRYVVQESDTTMLNRITKAGNINIIIKN